MTVELLLGDTFDIIKTMDDKSVQAIITDPPYNFNAETREMLQREFVRVCSGAIIVFCPPENQWASKCDQYLFWTKPISTKNTSRSYSRFVEIIQVWNGDVWNSDRHWSQYVNVANDFVEDKVHPFAKPVSLMTRLIRNHTNRGSLVLDPFMGSGTTGLACIQSGRNFMGIEIDEGCFHFTEERIAKAYPFSQPGDNLSTIIW